MSNPQALAQTIQNAATNAAARQALIADPHKALAAAGFPVPANVKLSVHVNDATTFHAALPQETAGEIEMVRALNPVAATVYQKAWRDPAYKKELMTHPREAFVEATGITPPASLKLIPHENSANELHIIVPYVPPKSELSDADLEHIAGGKGGSSSKAKMPADCEYAMSVGSAAVTMAGGIASSGVGAPVAAVAGLGGLLTTMGAAIASAAMK